VVGVGFHFDLIVSDIESSEDEMKLNIKFFLKN